MAAQLPVVWKNGDCLTAAELNANFEWLCNQLDLAPEVVAEVREQLAGLTTSLASVEEKCEGLLERIEALENP